MEEYKHLIGKYFYREEDGIFLVFEIRKNDKTNDYECLSKEISWFGGSINDNFKFGKEIYCVIACSDIERFFTEVTESEYDAVRKVLDNSIIEIKSIVNNAIKSKKLDKIHNN